MSEFTDWERGQMHKETAKRANRIEIEVLVCPICLNEVEPDENGETNLIECSEHSLCQFNGCRECFMGHLKQYSKHI